MTLKIKFIHCCVFGSAKYIWFILYRFLHRLAVGLFIIAATVNSYCQDNTSMREMALRMPMVFLDPGESQYSSSRRLFQGIPGIERAPGGRLWVTCFGGGLREGGISSQENYVMLLTSDDDGRTWSDLKVVVDMPEDPVRLFNPCLWTDPAGRLWFFWAQAYTPARHSGVWAMVTENPDDPDPGWSEPRRLCEGIMLNKPTVLSNGDWLLATDIGKTENSCRVEISTDQGKTFSLLGTANIPEPGDRSANEHMIIEKKGGSLWMLVRTNYGLGESFSYDGGITWSPVAPASIKHAVSRFHIRRLSSGNLLLVKHGPIDRQTQRNFLTAYISNDDGITWQGGLLLDERFVSYPDAKQSSDGRIWLVYDHGRYEGTDREILMAAFTEADVLAGTPSDDARIKVLVHRAIDPIPDGYTLYNDFGDQQNIPWTDPLKGSFTDRMPDPDTSVVIPGSQTGKVIALYGGWSHVHFNFPQYLDLATNDTFRLKIYYRGTETDVRLSTVKLILRNNGDYSTQYTVETCLERANTWQEYIFVFRNAHLRNNYNQLWVFFNSPSDPDPVTGEGIYIDDLMGPPLKIEKYAYIIMTSQTGDSIILDYTAPGRKLAPVSYPVHSNVPYPVFSLYRNGWEQIPFRGITNDSSAVYLHIEPGLEISPRDRLNLSYISGNIEDINGYELGYFSWSPVINTVPVEFFHLRFIISDTETGKKLENVYVLTDSVTDLSNLLGEVLFEVLPGNYDYRISKEHYFGLDSGLEITADTTVHIMITRSAANLKFRILSGEESVYRAQVDMNGEKLLTNPVGVVLFENLDRFKDHTYSISKAGFFTENGIVQLKNDTVVEINLVKDMTFVPDLREEGTSIYPDPAFHKLLIVSDKTIHDVELYSINSRLLGKYPVNDHEYALDMSGIIPGVYVIKICSSGRKTFIRRFVLTR